MLSDVVYNPVHLIIAYDNLQFVVPPVDQRRIEVAFVAITTDRKDCAATYTNAF